MKISPNQGFIRRNPPVQQPALAPQAAQSLAPPRKPGVPNPRGLGLQFGYGGQLPQKFAQGGEVQGPPHEEGGVPVVDEATQEPMAEVEGGERIFSIEDTQMMEQAAQQIMELSQQDPQGADEAAKQLGYAVVEMLQKQMANQQEMMGQGAPAQGGEGDILAQAANQFV